MPPAVDEKELRKLLAQKLPQREIAKRLNVPRTTLQRMMKGLDTAPAAEMPVSAPPDGVPVVDMGKLTPEEVEAVRGDFWEVIEWWRERRRQQVYQSTPRETARQTYHVEKRYIASIHREAVSEGVSITEVVNRAFRAYFERKAR